ncbi:MAG: hypothetical protein AB9866_25335 [Syntrophobacteraceae bacterium]
MPDKESVDDSRGKGVLRVLLRIAVVLVLLAAGLSGGLGYGKYHLGKERKAHQEKINEVNKKVALLQNKSSEERSLRSSLESQKRGLTGEVEKLRKENTLLAEEIKKVENKTEGFEGKIKELSEESKRLKAARDETSAQLAQVVQVAGDLEIEVKRLTTGKQTLEASLAKVNQDLDKCRTNNGKLCTIADEMLQRQKPKNMIGALIQNEPVTQLKKVEVEKYVQEYKDKIHQEKLKSSEQ